MELSFTMTIPNEEYPVILQIATMDKKDFDSLVDAIEQNPIRYHPRSFINDINSVVTISNIDVERVMRTVFSLYNLKSQIPTTTDDLVPRLVKAFFYHNKDAYSEHLENILTTRLTKLLKIYNPLGIVATAYKAATDSERCIIDTNPFLDLRPIFNEDTQELLSNVILYRMKLSYLVDDQPKHMNFTFDLQDILKLKNQLEQLIEKSENLQSALNESKINVLDSNPS